MSFGINGNNYDKRISIIREMLMNKNGGKVPTNADLMDAYKNLYGTEASSEFRPVGMYVEPEPTTEPVPVLSDDPAPVYGPGPLEPIPEPTTEPVPVPSDDPAPVYGPGPSEPIPEPTTEPVPVPSDDPAPVYGPGPSEPIPEPTTEPVPVPSDDPAPVYGPGPSEPVPTYPADPVGLNNVYTPQEKKMPSKIMVKDAQDLRNEFAKLDGKCEAYTIGGQKIDPNTYNPRYNEVIILKEI